MQTTLNKIRQRHPCTRGWTKLLAHLGKTTADDQPLHLRTVLTSNGIADALWCLRAADDHEREMRLFAVWCARQVQHLLTRPHDAAALDVVERHANGLATDAEVAAVYAAGYTSNAVYAVYAHADAAYAVYAVYVHAAVYAADAADAAAKQAEELTRVLDCIDAGTDPYPHSRA